MSVLDTLITDRTQAHVDRLKALMRIGWQNMSDEEKAEYLGGGLEQLRDANNQPLFDSNNEPLYSDDAGGVQKGAYNYTDLNRVEEAVDYVADELVQADTDLRAYAASLNVAWDSLFELPYDPADYTSLTIKTNWTDEDIPSVADMTRYIGNLSLIQASLLVPIGIPASMNALDYNGANNIERMLKDTDTALAEAVEYRKMLIRAALAVFYSGELYSGELPMGGDT